MPEAFNRQNRKSQRKPLNVSVFSEALFTQFSVNKLQKISQLKDLNGHLTLKAAKT